MSSDSILIAFIVIASFVYMSLFVVLFLMKSRLSGNDEW